jgi:glycine cleavage system regulatory protein
MGGTTMFYFEMLLNVPDDVGIDSLKGDFEELADLENLEVKFFPLDEKDE